MKFKLWNEEMRGKPQEKGVVYLRLRVYPLGVHLGVVDAKGQVLMEDEEVEEDANDKATVTLTLPGGTTANLSATWEVITKILAQLQTPPTVIALNKDAIKEAADKQRRGHEVQGMDRRAERQVTGRGDGLSKEEP